MDAKLLILIHKAIQKLEFDAKLEGFGDGKKLIEFTDSCWAATVQSQGPPYHTYVSVCVRIYT